MIGGTKRSLLLCTSVAILASSLIRLEHLFASDLSGDGGKFPIIPVTGAVQFRNTKLEKRVPARFRLKEHEFSFTSRLSRFSGPVRISRVTYPSPIKTDVFENNTVHGEYFQPEGSGPYPGVVVLHILGGEFALSQMIANSLARKRIAAIFIKMPYYGERRGKNSKQRMISREPKETVEGMTQAVLDIRRAAAWLAARPEVDANQLGVTGISLGGIMSALSASAEPRFRKVAIYLGGGNLATAVWDLDNPEAEKFRKQWLAAGGSRDTFLRTLAPVDPATYGHLLKDREVLMVAAKNDEIIPASSTLALWESIGRKPKLVWLDAGHITAARYIFGEVTRMQAFFAPTLHNQTNSERTVPFD